MDPEDSMDIKIKQELHEEVTYEDNEGALMDVSVSNGSVKLEDKVKRELREGFANEIDDNTEYLCELCKTYFPNLSSFHDHMQNNDNCDEKIGVKSPKNSVNFDAMQNIEVKEASVEGKYTEKVEIGQEAKCNEMKTQRKRQRTEEKGDRIDSEKDEHESDKRELVNLIMKDHIILRKVHDDGIFDMASFKIVKKEETESIIENDNDELVNLVMKDHIILRVNNPAQKSIFMKIEASEETSQDSVSGKSNIHAEKLDGRHNQINNELCETTHDTIINFIGDAYYESNSRKRGVSCDVCKKTFTRRSHLARHVKRFHLKTNETETPSPNQKHVCTPCDKSYESREKLKTHLYNAHTSPVFCDVCSKKFSRRKYLARHVKRIHLKTNETENTPSSNQKHVCTPCDKSYESREKLRTPLYNAHKSPVFCDVCSKKFSRRKYLTRHVKRIHLKTNETENTPSSNQKHVCTPCDKSYESREKLKTHLYNAHRSPVFCDFCSKKFSRKYNLERHMKVVHFRIQETENNVCTLCDKSYENKEKLKSHLYNAHKGPVYCDFCSKKFSRKASLEKHVKGVHLRTDVYECMFCKKKYFNENLLNRHTRLYCTKEKPIRCKHCRNKYACQKNFETHMADHPRFICDYCDKIYYDRCDLQKHIASKHMNLNVCKLCRKKYVSQKTFEMHMADHPRFICDHCDAVFYLKSSVFNHIQRIHLKVRHRCKKCGNKYDYLYLKRHVKRCKENID